MKDLLVAVKEWIKEHFNDWLIYIADGEDRFPFWTGLCRGVWIVYLSLLISSLLPKNRGKVLDWVDKV